jgi:hypothetical protein
MIWLCWCLVTQLVDSVLCGDLKKARMWVWTGVDAMLVRCQPDLRQAAWLAGQNPSRQQVLHRLRRNVRWITKWHNTV